VVVPSLLLLAALVMTGQGLSLPARLALLVAAERIAVPVVVKASDFFVEPLTGTIELRRVSNPKLVAQKMAASAGQICPEVEATATGVVIHCRTKRMEAYQVVERGKMYIEVEQLRGLPWRHEADQLKIFYDPEETGFGGPCPGTLAVGRAECALRDGRIEEAQTMFRDAMAAASQASFAGVRLGDIAVANGDVAAAINYYKRASYGDLFGRVAASRVCELDGKCLPQSLSRVFRFIDQPEPVRSEMLLRGARAAIFVDLYADAASLLKTAIDDRAVGVCTRTGQLLCRRMLLVVLQNLEGDEGATAVETYLAMPDHHRGPLAMELMRAAAERAAASGAPAFAANLLAANATAAEGPGLGEHLLRTAEFYIQAADTVRARVVLDYADTRAGRNNGFGGPRWAAVRAAARETEGEPSAAAISAFELLAAEGARDVANAYGTIARARTVRP
jgi:hypothetical protein